MHEGQVEIDDAALRTAIAAQFPHLAGEPMRAVRSAGTVVAPVRIGEKFVARLPLVPSDGDDVRRRLHASGAHARELAGALPVAVTDLVSIGEPFPGYPGAWSVWTWLDGQSLDRVLAGPSPSIEPDRLAVELATVLRAIRALPVAGPAWSENARGGRPLADSEWVRTSIERSSHLIDPGAATAVWERALEATPFEGPPTRIHGDPMPGNLLVSGGRLSGLIDISEPASGDPAADLQPAWTVFDGPHRESFRQAMVLDGDAWERGRGWAFEMAIGGLHYYEHTNREFFGIAHHTLRELMREA